MSIPQKSLDVIRERSGGKCETCGAPATQTQHRQPRGMGGRSGAEVHRPSNLIRVCGYGSLTGCHREMEINPSHAYVMGWRVHRGQDPATVPVLLLGPGWVMLTDDGQYVPVETTIPHRSI